MDTTAHQEAPHASVPTTPALRGVALLGFATESSFGARVDWSQVRTARALRARGIPCRLFQIHFHPRDEAENARRMDQLVAAISREGHRWAMCTSLWTRELGDRLIAKGIGLVEERDPVHPASLLGRSLHELPFDACAGPTPLDPTEGLIELIGLPPGVHIAHVDLRVRDCGYQRPIAENPFYRELADDPTFGAHRGCAHCFSAMQGDSPSGDLADLILKEVRDRRALLPALQTLWLPYAETFYDALGAALDRSVGDPVFRGLSLSMQCRPDVIAQRRSHVEALAGKAHAAGLVLKINVMGFENFSPPEIEVLNRGVLPADLDTAARIFAEWKRTPPPGLDVSGTTPSFILFTPWTRMEDLELNLREIDRLGLRGANIERLRVGPASPVYEKARRTGLLGATKARLTVHPDGYHAEVPLGWADARAGIVSDGLDVLKPRAFTRQVELLAAIVDAVKRSPDPSAIDWASVASTWASIRRLCESATPSENQGLSADPRKIEAVLRANGHDPGRPERRVAAPVPRRPRVGATQDGTVGLAVGPACNSGCQPCVWTRKMSFRPLAVAGVDVAGRRVELGGREPTMRADLPALIQSLVAGGAAEVLMETNGRRFAYPKYALRLAHAGLDGVSVKLFGVTASAWDAHTRDEGSFVQTLLGLAELSMVRELRVTGVAYPGHAAGTRVDDYLAFGASLGLARLRLVLELSRQDLLALPSLEARLRELASTPGAPVVCVDE